MLGEKELEGIDIYDIHHAANKNYYLATSTGLIVYDGYDFVSVLCDELATGSVFNLVEDYSGNVYCNTLSGNVYRHGANGCELFFTIPDSLRSADIGLEIDNLNRVLVRASKLLFVSAQGELVDEASVGYSAFPRRMADSSLWTFSRDSKDFLVIKDGEIERRQTSTNTEGDFVVLNMLSFAGRWLEWIVNDGAIYDESGRKVFDPVEITSKKQSYRIYPTTNSLWLAPNSTGVYQFNRKLQLNNKKPFFPKTLISTVHEDDEGNLLLGTFGKGVIVIPNEHTRDVELPYSQEEIISIASSDDGTVYLGTLSGRIYRKEDVDISLFRDSEAKRMESLFTLDEDELLIGENTGILLQNGREIALDVGAVKDAVVIDKNRLLVGSNMGCFWVDRKTGKATRIEELSYRHYSLAYDSLAQLIYSGNSKGLGIMPIGGEVRFEELDGKKISARAIECSGNRAYAATSANGLLIFEGGVLVNQWNVSSGLISNNLLSVQVKQEKVVVSSDKGVQILDLEGGSIQVIQGSDGLASERVYDFELLGNDLWVVHRKGAQTISLNQLNSFEYTPTLTLDGLLVNDTLQVELGTRKFKPNQQKFAFDLTVNDLRHQNEISYQYRLKGAESAWQTSPYNDHVIQYQSLSPGDYTFQAKAICRGNESEELYYSFTIATPFYMAWWFYAIVAFGLILLLFFWFRSRLKRQAFLAEQQNELNASKLTAIQSQMNPHFIFNALNSIQDLVLKGDVTNSYTYITKFADLVRRTLNYSDKDFIDFEHELKLIELYLTLEKLRFKTNFEFSIHADGVEDIQLPPMLIQPFIENALVHGLLHLEGDKKLDLKFELNENLVCTITDNGVGREKAKEIKERQRSSHESFSVNAIKRRFEILQRNFGGELGFTTEDLTENGEASGTRVKLVIPVKRKF